MRIITEIFITFLTVGYCSAKNRYGVLIFPEINFGATSQNNLCNAEIELYQKSLENLTLWAHEMWDASAKSPTGFLRGSLYNLGSFHECLTTLAPFETQYCISTIEANVPTPDQPYDPFLVDYSPYESVLRRIHKTENIFQISRHAVQMALCIPASCNPDDLEKILNDNLSKTAHPLVQYDVTFKAKVSPALCQTRRGVHHLDAYDISFCVVCLTLIFIVIASTTFDYYMRKTKSAIVSDAKWINITLAFSWLQNFEGLAEHNIPNPELHVLYGFKGICVITMIMLHKIVFFALNPVSNFDYLENQMRSKLLMLASRGDYFTDTFFLTSGMVATYGLLQQLEKKSIRPLFVIVYRYLRLLPVYAFVIFFTATLYNHTGSGPLWKLLIGREVKNCRKNWWTNLFFVNSYVNDEEMCLIHSWYLQCEFHFFIIGLLITKALSKRPKQGMGLLAIFATATVIITYAVTTINKANPFVGVYPSNMVTVSTTEEYRLIYSKSHMRAAPYAVGIFLGYIFYKLGNLPSYLSKVSSYIVMGLSFLTIYMCLETSTKFYNPYYSYNTMEAGIQAAFQRIAWGFGSGGLLFVASYGYIPVLKSILTWRIWIPINKLGFCIYLTHLGFHYRNASTTVSPKVFDYFDVLSSFISDLVLTIITSTCLYLMVEVPFQRIFNYWLGLSKSHVKKRVLTTTEEKKKIK